MTDNDIAARLRAVLHNDRSVELMNREAADEIERLRTERDEAQRMVCIMKAQSVTYAFPPEHFAKQHGWDCYKENT